MTANYTHFISYLDDDDNEQVVFTGSSVECFDAFDNMASQYDDAILSIECVN